MLKEICALNNEVVIGGDHRGKHGDNGRYYEDLRFRFHLHKIIVARG